MDELSSSSQTAQSVRPGWQVLRAPEDTRD
jgi:hypothetical protein